MASPRTLAGSLVSVAAFVAAASCGGSNATNDPLAGGGDAGTPDVTTDTTPGPPCPPPNKKICGDSCVDTTVDAKNCGICGVACKGAEQCVASRCSLVAGFAARKVYLGETDRAGVASSTAWQGYGRDIDGITTVVGNDQGECKRVAGAASATQADGPGGIDNSFGKNIVAFLLALSPTPSKNASDVIEVGGRTPMIAFGAPPPATGALPAFSFVTADTTGAPKWDGLDTRPVAESSTSAGKPKTVFSNGTLTAGVLGSGDASAPFVLSFAFGGTGTLDVPIRLARVSMTIAADGKTATNGTISGVVDAAEFEAAFVKVAGALSTSLCSGSTLDSIKQTIRQASDILVDGTQDPLKDCNAISIGVGFNAALVAVGPVAAPVTPSPDPCAP
jgi:hypothetical protein